MSLYTYKFRLVRVIDADTLELECDLGFGVFRRDKFRLAGINAPEKNTDAGREAISFVYQWLAPASHDDLTVTTVKDKQEKFGRYLATIAQVVDGKTLNQALLDSGHAKPY